METEITVGAELEKVPRSEWPDVGQLATLAVQLRQRCNSDKQAVAWAARIWAMSYLSLQEWKKGGEKHAFTP